MPQRCKPCQDKAVEQTFVVDSSRLLSFAVGFVVDNQCDGLYALDGFAKLGSQASKALFIPFFPSAPISMLLKANYFLPKSFSEAPI